VMFQRWYDDAVAAAVYEPNAMVVASVSADGRPSARMVLLKGFSPEGWVFFTNLGSRKGVELRGNPHCSLLFPWHPLERQVRVDLRRFKDLVEERLVPPGPWRGRVDPRGGTVHATT